MKNILHHTVLDKAKWDAFVVKNNASIFSTSLYLDSTAQDWSVYFDEENNLGLALPFVEKIGVKGMYPPFFHRYIEKIGENDLPKSLLDYIQKEYKFGFIHTKEQLNLPNESSRIHQIIEDFDNLDQSSQFKRSVKKALKNNYEIRESENVTDSFQLVIGFLSSKLDFYKSNEVEQLKNLIHNLDKQSRLITYNLIAQGKVEGSLFVMKHQNTFTYLKGSCSDEVTKNGGMYLLMNELIENCKSSNVNLDFGGSQVEGVRNFNIRLGGKDRKYYTYEWDNSPFWFKTLKKIRKWIKK